MARLEPTTIRTLLRIAAVVLLLTAWTRGALHWLLRDEVRRIVAESTLVADPNRDFVADSQDWLAIAWLALPLVVGALLAVTLLLGIGHLLLIGTSCVLGSALLVTGVLFPSAVVLHVLAVVAVAALLAVVLLVVSQPAALVAPRRDRASR